VQEYMKMPDGDLFVVWRVRVGLPPEDLPGSRASRVVCGRCGEEVSDRREVREEGAVLCRACAHGAYYEVIDPPSEPSS
jgi:formylmethanofuran dehydrogenase subunit E